MTRSDQTEKQIERRQYGGTIRGLVDGDLVHRSNRTSVRILQHGKDERVQLAG